MTDVKQLSDADLEKELSFAHGFGPPSNADESKWLAALEAENSVRTEAFDTVGFIIAFEGGEVTDDELIEGFQHLIDTGQAWSLQGVYGRTARALIDHGYCSDPANPWVLDEDGETVRKAYGE